MAKVGIVLVNYNGLEVQEACVLSLERMIFQDYEVVVVDNHSSDGSVERLKQLFPRVHVLEQQSNCGYAAGNNIGIRYSMQLGTEYTLLLNNDTEVSETMLAILMRGITEKSVTVPKIYFHQEPEKIWSAGGTIQWGKGETHNRGIYETDCGQYEKEEAVTFAPACCMLIPNKIFLDIGCFNEKYFMYFEDTDFCMRLQEAGYLIKYMPESILWHKVSSSTGGENSLKQIYYMTRNRLFFYPHTVVT